MQERRKDALVKDEHRLVTVGMTAYNGERYIAKAIESILTQEYRNFELIIYDNASEDRTSEICGEYANKDDRIKYYRNHTNIGPNANSLKVLDVSSGQYMQWVSDHDIYHPQFISHLIKELDKDESVVLCYPRTVCIDANDNVIEPLTPDVIDTRGLDTFQRFSKVIWEFAWGNMIMGLFRMSVVRKIFSHPPVVIGPDHVMMADASLLGHIAQVNEPLYYRRMNHVNEDAQAAHNRHIKWFVKSKSEALVPWTMMAYEHIKILKDSDILSQGEKERLFDEVRKCFPARFGGKMQHEASRLITEGLKVLRNASEDRQTQRIMYMEFARLASICRFFYPEIKELGYFISIGNQLFQPQVDVVHEIDKAVTEYDRLQAQTSKI